jgi:hypothetical protein
MSIITLGTTCRGICNEKREGFFFTLLAKRHEG